MPSRTRRRVRTGLRLADFVLTFFVAIYAAIRVISDVSHGIWIVIFVLCFCSETLRSAMRTGKP